MTKNLQALDTTLQTGSRRVSLSLDNCCLFNISIVIKAWMFCFVHPGFIFLVIYQKSRYDKFFSLMAFLVFLGEGYWLAINFKYIITKKYC